MFAISQVLRHRVLLFTGFIAATLLSVDGISLSARAQTNFGSVNIGSSSTVSVPLTVSGTLRSISVLTQGAANLDFNNVETGTCAINTAYAANSTCAVAVAFSPKSPGTRYGAVVLRT